MKFKEGDRGWVTTLMKFKLLVGVEARVGSFYLVRLLDPYTILHGAEFWVGEGELSQGKADIRPQVDVLSRLHKNLDEVRGRTAPTEHDPVNYPIRETCAREGSFGAGVRLARELNVSQATISSAKLRHTFAWLK